MLKGLKVIDVGATTVGPSVDSILGSLGTDVIRIEPPHIDPLYYFDSWYFHFLTKSIRLQLMNTDEADSGGKQWLE